MNTALALLEVNCTIPCHAVPLHTVPGCFTLQAFKCSSGKRTLKRISEVPIGYALDPDSWVRHIAYQWGTAPGFALRSGCPARHGTVSFGTLWTTLGSDIRRSTLPDWFSTGTVCFRCIQGKHHFGIVWYGKGMVYKSAWMHPLTVYSTITKESMKSMALLV